ncbi:MAG: MATE family efflux transporter [Treponema sp.]|nr:MATE family efflux transporter [Treponema sp.]
MEKIADIQSQKFNWTQFVKMICAIAIPVALQNLLTTTGGMIDTMMISSLGETYVAAVGLCAQFSMLMFSCYWGFVGGGVLFFSQFWGAKDHKGIAKSYGVTTACMMVVACIFTILAVGFPHLVLKIYTDKIHIQEIGVDYVRIVGLAYIMQVLSVGMSSLLRATERVKIPLYASIASVFTNTFCNWLLIFGHWGFPALGVKGAAIATVISAAVNVLVILICATATKYPYLFMVKDFFKWNKEFIGLYVKKCFPIICNELLLGVGFMIINIVLGHQPEEAIAALAVFRTIEGLVIGFFAGFSSAASVLVGKEVGAGNTFTAYKRAIRIVYFCQATIGVLAAILLLLHGPLLKIMNLKGPAFEYGKGMVIIYSLACIIRMGNWTQNDTYRSAGDALFGTVLEIVFMFLMVLPSVLISNYVFHAPFLVVFAMCYVDEIIRYIIMQIHMYSGKWIKPVTPEGIEGLEEFKTHKHSL